MVAKGAGIVKQTVKRDLAIVGSSLIKLVDQVGFSHHCGIACLPRLHEVFAKEIRRPDRELRCKVQTLYDLPLTREVSDEVITFPLIVTSFFHKQQRIISLGPSSVVAVWIFGYRP